MRVRYSVQCAVAFGITFMFLGLLAAQDSGPQPGARIVAAQSLLKIRADYMQSVGLKIYEVYEGPAKHVLSAHGVKGYLEQGDAITEIDGKKIQSLENYIDLLETSADANGGNVVLTVVDVHGKGVFHWNAQIRPRPLPGERHLHVLLIGLTNDPSIGRAQDINLKNVRNLIKGEIPAAKIGSIRIVKGEDCTARKIRASVEALEIAPRDTLFVYYGGHGGYDPSRAKDDSSGGHHFQIPSGDLMRRDLMERLLAKGARLTVLITDTCNVKSMAHPAPEGLCCACAPIKMSPTALEILLLYNRGVIDISASSRDQFSWSDGNIGGWFTSTACGALCWSPLTWKTAFEGLAAESNDFFKNRRKWVLANPGQTGADALQALNDQTQTVPQAFKMAVISDPVPEQKPVPQRAGELAEPYRLGFRGEDLPRIGVRVLSVGHGSPAENLFHLGKANQPTRLERGDVVIAVDGQPVRSLEEYLKAMRAVTPGQVRITIRDIRSKQPIELGEKP